MIHASVGALPGLVSVFLLTALVLGIPAALTAAARNRPLTLALLFTTALSGVLAVTLTPGGGGSGEAGRCDAGLPAAAFVASESARLNFLLFVPLCFLAVLLFARPVTVAVGAAALACTIEFLQSWASLGRACTYDDIVANAAGGVAGALCGTVVLWIARRRLPVTRADLAWGAALAVAGAVALTAAFRFSVTTTDFEARSQRNRAVFRDMDRQDRWMNRTVPRLLGQHATVTGSATVALGHGRFRLTAQTTRGTVVALWPARTLESLRAKRGRGDEGRLTRPAMKSAGEKFARTWFPRAAAGPEPAFRPLPGTHGAALLSYRRPARGATAPLRLDITVTTSGRIVAVKTAAP
ncbi:VanZ family protein [Streptomyces sp. NPDC053427]|uniref:VanZ family protein n=1 Tax=Streptomyces sp. NPDC053427 TaxID=3365701 RepID=UPI0037D151CA